uniref:Uncharacterized protein n=1 Tax=Panagrolaimus davidi TaxID=227884 RepID=A0A914QLQ9_9BILA
MSHHNCGGTNHIASKYSKPIMAFVDRDSTIVVERNTAVSAQIAGEIKGFPISASGEVTSSQKAIITRIAQRHGFTPIDAHSFLPFKTGHAETKYIFIFDDSGRNISSCFPVGCNESVLVNQNGYIRKSVHNDIWSEKL